MMQSVEVDPTLDGVASLVEEFPSQRSSHAEAGIVGGAATDAHEHLAGSGVLGGLQRGTEASGVEFEGVEAARRELRKPDDGGRLDQGAPGMRIVPPMRLDGTMGCINGLHGSALSIQALGQDRSEAVAAVADGQQGERVVGSNASPSLGDGMGCCCGGEGAFELVGNDKDAKRHRTRGWSARGLLGKLGDGE